MKGRAIRICSHMDLPYNSDKALNQRHVDVYTYLSVFRDGIAVDQTIKNNDMFQGQLYSTDRYINELASRKETLSKDFLDIAKAMAVDCELNKSENEIECQGIALANTQKSDFLYDPRLDTDLSKGESVVIKKRELTKIEQLVEEAKKVDELRAGLREIPTKAKDPATGVEKIVKVQFYFVPRRTNSGIVFDIYDGKNTEAKTKKGTITEAQYQTKFGAK